MQVISVTVFFQYKKKEWTELTIRPSLKTFSIPKPIAFNTCRGFPEAFITRIIQLTINR